MSKQKTVLFGAGIAGEYAYKSLRKEYNIVAFIDNDPNKHGTKLMNTPVLAPADLANLEYDSIHIASIFASEMMYQLRQELNIPEEKIALVDSDILNGDDEVPWGCLGIIVAVVVLIGWGLFKLLF